MYLISTYIYKYVHILKGLFEDSDIWPAFLNPENLKKEGYNVNTAYKPFVSLQELQKSLPKEKQEIEFFYNRKHFVTENIIQSSGSGSTSLIVAHSTSLDACSRKLLGYVPKTDEEFKVMRRANYCQVLVLQETGENSEIKWVEKDVPCLSLTHSSSIWKPGKS